MKKHWLRGLLLGVSVALLMGGGVALAQASMHAWPECFQCLPEEGAEGPYYYSWESCGWEAGMQVYLRQTFANGEYRDGVDIALGACIAGADRYLPCEEGLEPVEHKSDAIAANGVWPDDYWGPFEICASIPNSVRGQVSADQIVCDTILFAEVCEEEVEFVPEPGTLMLLGSGLAGLAGYAGLRWRTRE